MSWPCCCVKVTSPAGTSLGLELDDPLNLLEAKIAAVGLRGFRNPATCKAKTEGLGTEEALGHPGIPPLASVELLLPASPWLLHKQDGTWLLSQDDLLLSSEDRGHLFR